MIAMGNHKLEGMLDTTIEKVNGMIDADSIIGKSIVSANGTVIIPISKVSYGFAAGGSDIPTKQADKELFGGGSGSGVTISPVAFLVITDGGDVKLLQIESFSNTLDRIVAMAPDMFDKIKGLFKKDKNKEKHKEKAEKTDDILCSESN